MSRGLEMKLFATEWTESTFSKLSFWIQGDPSGDEQCYESPQFNIHNIVDIRIMMTGLYNCSIGRKNCNNYDCSYKFEIATRKATLPKDLTVKLDLRTNVKSAGNIVSCTEEWSDWHVIIGFGAFKPCIEVWVDIKVSKVDSIIMKLYEDEEFTDFQLSTTEGSVAVHKAQLAANSEVFKTMLQREWKETTEGRINMEGVTLQTLQHLKDYMYLGTLPSDGLYPLLHLSMCYMIDNLKAECLMKLAQTVTAKNLYDILAYSFINNIPELTFVLLGAMPKSIVEDARQIMIESQKSCKKAETDKTDEPEQSKE